MTRTRVPDSTQAEVLVQSRRRCCVCYGLHRDQSEKKGQIAHLDGDRNNNRPNNLAFLCFDHHDQFDSRTSQSKNLQRSEIEIYRQELYTLFGSWGSQLQRDELLNFLAFYVADFEALISAAIKAGESVTYFGVELAFDVLITEEVGYTDGDLYFPHVSTLALFASWGWMTYVTEEREDSDGEVRYYVTADRKPICDRVAKGILERYSNDPQMSGTLMDIAVSRNWSPPSEG